MTVDVQTEILIARPQAQVAEYAANPENAPSWYANIQSVEWRTAPPPQGTPPVGAQVAFVAQFLGRRMAYTYEIIESLPGERLVMHTSEGPFPMETIYTWETTPSGLTRMTLQNRGEPAGLMGLLAPVTAIAMRRANRKDLDAVKRVLENTGSFGANAQSGAPEN